MTKLVVWASAAQTGIELQQLAAIDAQVVNDANRRRFICTCCGSLAALEVQSILLTGQHMPAPACWLRRDRGMQRLRPKSLNPGSDRGLRPKLLNQRALRIGFDLGVYAGHAFPFEKFTRRFSLCQL
jgi:hypothetical protein